MGNKLPGEVTDLLDAAIYLGHVFNGANKGTWQHEGEAQRRRTIQSVLDEANSFTARAEKAWNACRLEGGAAIATLSWLQKYATEGLWSAEEMRDEHDRTGEVGEVADELAAIGKSLLKFVDDCDIEPPTQMAPKSVRRPKAARPIDSGETDQEVAVGAADESSEADLTKEHALGIVYIAIAMADGELADSESSALLTFLKKRVLMGKFDPDIIDLEEIHESVIDAMQNGGLATLIGTASLLLEKELTPKEQRELIAELRSLAGADGEVHENEEMIINALTNWMDL